MAKAVAPRFGIGEWYGRSFVDMSDAERKEFARLAKRHSKATAPQCPFSGKRCSKKGGVCTLRLYAATGTGNALAEPVEGLEGDLRTVCPSRFKLDSVYSAIGRTMLGTAEPLVATEVRFLQRPTGEDGEVADNEDVGNIDCVLVHPDRRLLRWCALEIQAVYFSGAGMGAMFDHILAFRRQGMPFPDAVRRPDYRSSGPKRLMPQLQIKVPTLRRWGKKMAVVVDQAWFRNNVIDVATVGDLSNCDIAWFLVGFDESTDPATLTVGEPEKQTLERAVEGLTGGYPVTLSEFETKIRNKLDT